VASPLGDTVRLAAGDASVVVAPDLGGRLIGAELEGHSLLYDHAGDAGPTSYGSFPMAPFAGRVGFGRFEFGGRTHDLGAPVGRHAIHGTVLDRRWTVEHSTTTTCVMTADLGPTWPWPGSCEQRLEISHDQLSLRLEVHSHDVAFPASAGWHPWFRTRLDDGRHLTAEVTASEQAERGPDHLPTGRWIPPQPRPWDDCLRGVTWPIRLRWNDPKLSDDRTNDDQQGALGIDLWSDASHVVVYDELAHAWCVEPQTAPPDSLGDGAGARAQLVTPDEPLIVTSRWRWIRSEGPYWAGE
jgi:aldose 1-epimerase